MKPLSPQQVARLQKMLATAQQAQKSRQWPQALQIYRDVLKEAPEAHDVRHQFAVLLATANQPAEAVKQFRLILKANPGHAATHANLAHALKQSGALNEAVKEFQRAISLDHTLTGAYIVLGEILREQGRSQDAIPYYTQALQLDTKNAIAFNGLGLAYRDLNDLPRALECLESAVGLAPEFAELRLNFGVTLRQAELDQWAAEQFYRAVELKPDFLESVVLLGEALEKLRCFDEAKECFDRALDLSPRNPELYERRGFVFLEMGDIDHALSDFSNALAINPRRIMGLVGLGRSHMEAGHTAEAADTFQKVIGAYPECTAGYYYLAASQKFKPDDPVISRMQTLAESTEDTSANAIDLNYAMGKIYDDCKQWDSAFAAYAKANRLRNEQNDYQPAAEEARFDRITSVFSRDFIDEHRDFGVSSKLPVLIVGMPRSGTTLTEQILSSHSRVLGAGEVDFWMKAPHAVPYAMRSSTAYPECVHEMSREQAYGISKKYLELLNKIAGSSKGHVRITDKMPHNFELLGLIALLFPDVPVIHCKRDAMDNCLSIFFQNFGGPHPYAYDLSNLGHHYKQYARLMAHWHEVLRGRILDINYEDMIANPEYWSRRLIEHIGLEWEANCLAPHKLERVIKTASHWQVRQPIYKTSVQRWRNYEPHLGPLKVALGYKEEEPLG